MFLKSPKSRIILALDTPDREQSLHVMDQCRDAVDAIKLNYPLVLQEGLSFIGELKKKYDLPIIADFKIADVPVTNNRIVRLAKNAGVDAVMVHGFIGPDAIMEVKEVAGDDMGVFVVTELTHPGGLEFTRPHAKQFAEMAAYLGCYGIQAPGTRPEQIRVMRETVGPDMKIIACGIGAQGGTLQAAIEAGADFGIIGRSIYEADDPREAAMSLARSCAEEPDVVKDVSVVRYCSETESYTLRVEPAREIREILKRFIGYCQSRRIGLTLHHDGGILLRKGKNIIHIYNDGRCLLSNISSVAEGEELARRWLEEIRSDMNNL
ncbi:orotidine-5'-phosphate decarboxylase [Paenibacillus thalictri]|uniref:Orotidine 5'-phosphate decarboxylase n=1 Tax=Paenibacillus thalictri TaxID=2527873 RepID=A0A4V2J337_9BACL|nr:orotidine-5'-phosphate decarboxylase [Paenibacillus thalictri]TBL69368.1 orotidine-5'-phosphate decarboxylase [Paenibacillus thalictri]